MKTKSKRILFALVAFAVLLVSVIGSLAIETNYELNQGNGSFLFGSNSAYLVSSDFEGFDNDNEALIKDYSTTAPSKVSDEIVGDYYYSEMNQKYSVNELIEWNFTFQGSGHNKLSSAGFSDYTFVCNDASLSDDSVVASAANHNLDFNVVVVDKGQGNDNPKYISISIPENTLEPNQTYYLYMTKDCYCKAGTPFNCAMVFKFETNAVQSEDEYVFAPQDSHQPADAEAPDFGLTFFGLQPEIPNSNDVSMLNANALETAGLVTIGEENFYYLRQKGLVNSDLNQNLSFCSGVSSAFSPSKVYPHIKLYNSKDFSEESLVAEYNRGISTAKPIVVSNRACATVPDYLGDRAYGINFSLDSSILQDGVTYYVVLDKGIIVGGYESANNYLLEFTTGQESNDDPIVEPEAKYDNLSQLRDVNTSSNLTLMITTPDASDVKTAGYLRRSWGNKEKIIYNAIQTPLDSSVDQTFAFDFMGLGCNSVSSIPDEAINIYDDYSLSEDHLVAGLSNEKLTDLTIVNAPVSQTGAIGSNISVKVPAGTLQGEKTYYFVIGKELSSPTNGGKDFGTDVIFKFTTETSETPEEPADPELVSSEGKDLLAKTYTDLELKNAPGDGYEYKFIVWNTSTNQWYKLQDFGPATTFRWYTGPAGVKNLYVDIKNKTDETDVKRVELTGVNVTDYGLKATLAIEPTGELAAKAQATLTATATGGTGEYQYKFIVFNKTTNQWYKLKDFGPESTFDWYTGPAGDKTLYVDVKDSKGVVERAYVEHVMVS